MQAGKMAATAIGGTLLLLQIAHHKGYIKVTLSHNGLSLFIIILLFRSTGIK